MSTDRGIECELAFARSLSRKPLNDRDKQALLAYDAEPTLSRWHDVAEVCVYGPLRISVWSAWAATSATGAKAAVRVQGRNEVHVNMQVDRHGTVIVNRDVWDAHPTREEFRRALFFATH